MIVGEVIAVVACVAAVVSAYHDGNQLFDTIKKKWKKHRRPPALTSDASPTDLEWSLRRGREEILTEWNAHANRLGRHFEDGDPLAREQMKDIVIELQSALLANLRENNADFDLLALVEASDRGRIKTITVFHNLYQRLTQAAPISPPISFGPVPIDPTSRLFYWINLIENQYLAQLPSTRYIQSRSSFPGARALAGSSSSQQLDMLNFIRQVEEQTISPESRRSSGSRASIGSLLSGRRRSSVESYSPRGESSSRFGSFGSGAGLPPMLETEQYAIVDRRPDGSYGSVRTYAADVQDYIARNQINRIAAAQRQQSIQRERAQHEMGDYTPPTEVLSARQHDSAPSSSGGDDMNYDPLTLEMTANPWIMDIGQTTTNSPRMDVDPEPSDLNWTRTYTPEPIPEPVTRMHPLRTNIIDSRYLLGMETPWAEELSPAENLERRRPAMMDPGIESRFIPQLRPEETIRQEHYTSPGPHLPPSSWIRPNSQPARLPQPNLHNPPTPVTTDTSPPIRPPISRPTHTPSISSSASGTSSTSSDQPRPCWPPSNDNNYAGFCKGAWKFSSGLGGFKVHSEPKGYYSMISKWRCTASTCFFEMPLAESRRNDPKLNTEVLTHPSTGIQYRWAFLAKSHMKCKRASAGVLKEVHGPFGCIFCCRERGGPVRPLEGLDVFMRHLLEHWGCEEEALLERARCVVGRVAAVEEDFDVNIPPLEDVESL